MRTPILVLTLLASCSAAPVDTEPNVCHTDIVFVLDESGSVGPYNFERMKSFVSELVGKLDVESAYSQVAVVTYSTSVGERFNLDAHTSVASLQSAISSLSFSAGGTNTAKALQYVRSVMLTSEAGDRNTAPNSVVVITDGYSTDPSATQIEADKLKSVAQTNVIAVGIGRRVCGTELNNIASEPKDTNVILIKDFRSKDDFQEQIKDTICSYVVPCNCPDSDIEVLKQLVSFPFDDEQKQLIYSLIVAEIATQHPDLAQLLESELLAAANYLPVVAADLFVQSLRLVIVTYPDIEQLKAQLIADYPVEIGRAFYALSPIIFEAFVTAIGNELEATEEDLQRLSCCLERIAETLQNIAHKVSVSAVCDIQADTGLPGYPITGQVVFAQPLMGGLTTISIDLHGFTDTNKHGFQVHEVNDTGYHCMNAGERFNPHGSQHGGPNDHERHVGDLGNIKASASGSVITTFKDGLVSLEGVNNVSGRTVVIHEKKYVLGRGGFHDSEIDGHSGPRIACCIIGPVSYVDYD